MCALALECVSLISLGCAPLTCSYDPRVPTWLRNGPTYLLLVVSRITTRMRLPLPVDSLRWIVSYAMFRLLLLLTTPTCARQLWTMVLYLRLARTFRLVPTVSE